MTDHELDSRDFLYGEQHSIHMDLSKAKQKSDVEDCIDEIELVSVAHKDDAFDTGMKDEQHTEVSILEDSMVIFIENMLSEMFLSSHYNSFKDFTSLCTDQINKARD